MTASFKSLWAALPAICAVLMLLLAAVPSGAFAGDIDVLSYVSGGSDVRPGEKIVFRTRVTNRTAIPTSLADTRLCQGKIHGLDPLDKGAAQACIPLGQLAPNQTTTVISRFRVRRKHGHIRRKVSAWIGSEQYGRDWIRLRIAD